jgi:hypothetical protein
MSKHTHTQDKKKAGLYTRRIHSKNNAKDIACYSYLMTAYVFVQNEENIKDEREDKEYE